MRDDDDRVADPEGTLLAVATSLDISGRHADDWPVPELAQACYVAGATGCDTGLATRWWGVPVPHARLEQDLAALAPSAHHKGTNTD